MMNGTDDDDDDHHLVAGDDYSPSFATLHHCHNDVDDDDDDDHDDDDDEALSNDWYLDYFTRWCATLRESLEQSLPRWETTDNDTIKAAFVATCRSIQSATSVLDTVTKLRNDLQQVSPPVSDEIMAAANQAVADATAAVSQAWNASQDVAAAVLESLAQFVPSNEEDHDLYDDADLVTYTVLTEATPQGLADYCTANPLRASQLMDALHTVDVLRRFLFAGGARNGHYGRAVELYATLKSNNGNKSPSHCSSSTASAQAVLDQLALAVALELADPYPLFNELGVTDAVQRYIYFQQSFLLGELDPAVPDFGAWQWRHVVNSDATEDELSWGRASLLAYRPDLALVNHDETKWQYCFIVRSDVDYKDPDFYKSPKSYDQILSGGGKVRYVA
jgi:hypothetical protein